jgi:hypothetical protein
MEHLPLWELCEGNLKGDTFTGEPEVYVEKGSRVGKLSSLGPRWESINSSHLLRTLKDG